MTRSKVIDLSTRLPVEDGEADRDVRRRLGREHRRRGFTVRDVSFLSRVYTEGLDKPLLPSQGEKAAAERLRRAGLLWRRRGAEEDGYLLTGDGEKLLELVIGQFEAYELEEPG